MKIAVNRSAKNSAQCLTSRVVLKLLSFSSVLNFCFKRKVLIEGGLSSHSNGDTDSV